ncbi:MAG: lamin tail domain-containing protein [Candidatus Marinimicrobia bacterium]|nr:lamin tail domain-containing protein [Candidatus Neomarinimicrobiota bacterium]MCF7829177.1 lamin tail domain-containing protein [Candidatus Neomarinimicrobiota bacterium]MCF7881170.1 lamin tail domain-containing protein [Candidatus Neomarinimicrobiota bacterium]
MKRLLISAFIIGCSAVAFGQITISEVMFDPTGDESTDEFVELYNTADSAVSVYAWQLFVDGSPEMLNAPPWIAPLSTPSYLVINPHSFAIILDLDYWDGDQTYDSIIPDSVKVMTIDDTRFGVYGLSNSTGRELVLKDSMDAIVSEYTYTPENDEGYSDEKIVLGGANSPSNWEDSRQLNGTPGFTNSVSPRDYDLALTAPVIWSPMPARPDTSLDISIRVKNAGAKSADAARIILSGEDKLGVSQIPNLASGDSTLTKFTISLPSGIHALIAELDYPGDQDTSNNTITFTLPVRFPENSVVINEIMYDPISGNPEWLELLNTSPETISLLEWTFTDESNIRATIADDATMSPEQPLVLAESADLGNYDYSQNSVYIPEDFPNLNNGSDGLVIRDASGAVIDTVYYSGNWGGGDGVSLERRNPYLSGLNPGNWASASSGVEATPTTPNSVMADSVQVELKNLTMKPGLAEPGESLTITGTLCNTGLRSLTVNSVGVSDYTDSAFGDIDKLGSIATHAPLDVGDSTEFRFDLRFSTPGLRRVVLSCELSGGDEVTLTDTTIQVKYPEPVLRINEIMYTPDDGEPEWIEMVNVGDKPVNLAGWQVRDAAGNTAGYSLYDRRVSPGHYIVIAGDSTLTEYYLDLPDSLICPVSDFPTLNNSGDSMVIIPPAGKPHDALEYQSSWGGNAGESLERRNIYAPATDASNWRTSQSEDGATPGLPNSIAVPDLDAGIAGMTLSSAETVAVTVRNYGLRNLPDHTLSLYRDADEDSIADSNELIKEVAGANLSTGDSVTHRVVLPDELHGYHRFLAEIRLSGDENPGNNTAFTAGIFGYPPETVKINEIMYRPEPGEPEWVEVYVARDSVDLRGFRVCDAGSESRIPIHGKQLYHSGEYVVFASDSSVLQSYPRSDFSIEIPDEFPTLNNGIDSVTIRDGVHKIQEKVEYTSDWGGNGVSLERVNLFTEVQHSDNWGDSNDESGATPGRVNSIATLEYDLAIGSESLTPTTSLAPDKEWQLQSTIRNVGLNAADACTINFQIKSAVSPAQTGSRRIELHLAHGDSGVISLAMPALKSGTYTVLLELTFEQDSRETNNFAERVISVPFQESALLLTEFAPVPGEGWSEFVEIYNPGPDAIELSGWKLADNSAKAEIKGNYNLWSKEYAILTPDSSVFREFRLPDSSVYIVLDRWRSLNNGADEIRVIDPAGVTVDSLHYTPEWNIAAGKSLERRRYFTGFSPGASSNAGNWDVSTSASGGTPGFVSSVAISDSYQIRVERMDSVQSVPPLNGLNPEYLVVNTGLKTINTIDFQIGIDENDDLVLNPEEIQGDTSLASLAPGDTVTAWSSLIVPNLSGQRRLIGLFTFNGDTVRHISNLWIPYPRQSVILNEFLPDPSEIYPAEFVEVVNTGDDTISLGNWRLLVNERSAELDSGLSVLPEQYVVISEDSLSMDSGVLMAPADWANLSNDGGTIQLFDQYGNLMDSLAYDNRWDLQAGRSQERVHLENGEHSVSNWRTSVSPDGATPGVENSIYYHPDSLATGWTFTPPTFSPDGDGFDDLLQVTYRGELSLDYVTIRIFDTVGRNIRTLVRDTPAPVRQTWLWDGRDYDDRIAPIGIYIVHIEYKLSDGNVREKIETVVLAKRL